MPRSVRHGGKKTYKHKNMVSFAKRQHKRMKNLKKSKSDVKLIRENWNKEFTPKENLAAMGLAYDPNVALPIRQPFRRGIDQTPLESPSEYAALGSVSEQRRKLDAKRARTLTNKAADSKKKEIVVGGLEADAAAEEEIQKARPKHKLNDRDTEFCIYMIERHGDDYKAMCRDPKNIWQDTPKQIARKIRMFMESPYYEAISTNKDI